MGKMHHHVPQFLQRGWADAKGRVKCAQWDKGAIKSFFSTPKNLMVESHLYRARNLDNPDHYEQGFSELEGHAAIAAAKFLNPEQPSLEDIDFESWATFILAQRARAPDWLRWSQAYAVAGFSEVISQYDPDYQRLATEFPTYTTEEHIVQYYPHLCGSFHLETMMEIAQRKKNLEALLQMKWFVRANFFDPIILGDVPIIMEGGLFSDACLIALSISSQKVFFAASTDEIKRNVTSLDDKKLGRMVNYAQATRARRQVIGEVAPRFLEKHLRRPEEAR